MKQDRTLIVTVWRQEGNGRGDGGDVVTNHGGDRRVAQLQNVEGINFNFTFSQIVD